MKRSSQHSTYTPTDAWSWSVRLLERWLTGTERVDWLLESLPTNLSGGERARVQALLLGAVRHLGRIQAELARLVNRPPRSVVEAALIIAGAEMLDAGDQSGLGPKVAHHLVERLKTLASAKEAGFANAVGRKLVAALTAPRSEPCEQDDLSVWEEYYSHPAWLIVRWREQFGDKETRALLQNNQMPAGVILRRRMAPDATAVDWPDWLTPVEQTPEFFTAAPGHWPELHALIDSGAVHVQDAATRLAIDLLEPKSGETVLDLCAAPGGKSLAMADRMQTGKIVAFDMPGRRMPRLKESLERVPTGVEAVIVTGNLLQGGERALEAAQQPVTYSAVLIDVPCSNSGVMRHRVDVKWRLQSESFQRHASQQLDLLVAAAARVAPGGRLIYSTCSIDREENEQVVEAFLKQSEDALANRLRWRGGVSVAAHGLSLRAPTRTCLRRRRLLHGLRAGCIRLCRPHR